MEHLPTKTVQIPRSQRKSEKSGTERERLSVGNEWKRIHSRTHSGKLGFTSDTIFNSLSPFHGVSKQVLLYPEENKTETIIRYVSQSVSAAFQTEIKIT